MVRPVCWHQPAMDFCSTTYPLKIVSKNVNPHSKNMMKGYCFLWTKLGWGSTFDSLVCLGSEMTWGTDWFIGSQWLVATGNGKSELEDWWMLSGEKLGEWTKNEHKAYRGLHQRKMFSERHPLLRTLLNQMGKIIHTIDFRQHPSLETPVLIQ